jgi:hypothetical protein
MVPTDVAAVAFSGTAHVSRIYAPFTQRSHALLAAG